MDNLYDVIVVGGGPAGLTAALYLARARYRVLVLEKEQFGGQIAITQEVINYPGILSVGGKALTETMQKQAENFGAEFLLAEVTGFQFSNPVKTVRTTRGDYACLGVLLATGAHPRKVGFRGEEEYQGKGVAYCATCDGEFFTGKDIYVVGGGYAAAEESLFLTKFARHVTVLIRKENFSCAASVAERTRKHEKITVLTHTILEEVSGEQGLNYLRYRNTETGERTEIQCPAGETVGIFVFAGFEPATDLVRSLVNLDSKGYILTDDSRKTNVDGVYAAGDVCVKPLRQVVTATGDGALAATELEKYVAEVQQRTGLHGIIPLREKRQEPSAPKPGQAEDGTLFTPEMRQQLEDVFTRMEQPLLLKLYLDQRPVSAELKRFVTELAELTGKLSVLIEEENLSDLAAPWVQVCRRDGTDSGLAFHGIPGGHEFTSFILGLYNVAGPGQTVHPDTRSKIAAIAKPVHIDIFVTLTCGMCPDLVIAAQHLAAENQNITAEVYDIQHFPDLKEHYRIMSVPCLVLNKETVLFGKKNMEQILSLLGA